ncbi:MACPF domain-containing protein At4g24290 isoform X1 [Solanum lycopersicum]|uniref:MACPF domain-containing protein At4g24290 isoform X1 n=1 Tax=Solanum lycopersicum TaxID=4081 RepID=UPI0002BC86F4|nr:MACPF domain-containing protein At4g24290 isoform X2 [Solanum lycopersicum]
MENSSNKETAMRLREVAEGAVKAIGLGFDIVDDLRLKFCKDYQLISVDHDQVRDISIPGGILVQNVPKSINCDKGERMRFTSDILSFSQYRQWRVSTREREEGDAGNQGNLAINESEMSERFNQDLSLSGKIPSGHFNAAFEYTTCWQKDAAYTKALAFDGVFITLYNIALEKAQVVLRDHVKQAIPSSWDPVALTRFIEKYGTHVIVGVKMGGKDVVYVKQQYSSTLQPADIQKRLKEVADERFGNANVQSSTTLLANSEQQLPFMDSTSSTVHLHKEDFTFLWGRRGGSRIRNIPHKRWCQTVPVEPDVISVSLIPISSLLSGIDGSGFLSHAINLYMRYKPPIEELYQFLEFQLPRQWGPVFGELPLGPERKQQSGATLKFSLMGPKLYVNTNLVDLDKPVTGLRLYLEGKRNNCLAIHLQHLSSLPKSLQLQNESYGYASSSSDQRYHEKVQWKSFSHVCTAPIESDDLSIVTGAQFEVRESGLRNVLFLRLQFSKVIGATVIKRAEWDGSPVITEKSGIISTISSHFSSAQKPPPRPSEVHINSALYPDGPPMSAQTRRLLKFVDTTEMMRGPQDQPGYWMVTGARLVVDKAKISLRVKFSLLAVVLPDEEESFQG